MKAQFLVRRVLRHVVVLVAAAGLALLLATDAKQAVRLQLESSSARPTVAQAEPRSRFFSDGVTATPLDKVKMRYYLTSAQTHPFTCSWATANCSTVTRRSGDDRYLKAGFTAGTPDLAAIGCDVHLSLSRADGHISPQFDPYCCGPQSAYPDEDRAAVHAHDQRIWDSADLEPTPTGSAGVLFDDFSYSASSDPLLARRGWTVRSGSGAPGVRGATWSPSAVSFPDGLLTLDSSTDGTATGTVQTALFTTSRKFHQGTYAARVRFSDTPTSGPDGEHILQTFFTITPLRAAMDPGYGELDFEYLPNGGWGESGSILQATSWETYQPRPWQAVNTQTEERASFAGWHDLVIQVSGERMRYYVDGWLFADHGDIYYPEQPMRIQFNQWFIDLNGGLTTRTYRQQVDWIYHSKNEVLSPADVQSRIATLRAAGTVFHDTVPDPPSATARCLDAGGPSPHTA